MIEIKSKRNNGAIEFTVKDNGLGMDLALYGNKVFSLFKRFHTHVEGKGFHVMGAA